MIRQQRQRLKILLAAIMLSACGSGGVDIGPTIADLAELPPILETAELQPQADFEFDRQQVIGRFR